MHLYFLFDVILIPFFSFQGCPKYIQARGNDQLPLSATGWWEEKEVAAVQTLAVAENSNADLKKKLTVEEQAQKSANSALEGAERQAESQRKLAREANDQLAASKEQLVALKKQLEEAQRLRDQAEKAKVEAKKAKAQAKRERDEAEQHG